MVTSKPEPNEFDSVYDEVVSHERPKSRVDGALDALSDAGRAAALLRLRDPGVSGRTLARVFARLAIDQGNPMLKLGRESIRTWRERNGVHDG